jgi:hypothetical protein
MSVLKFPVKADEAPPAMDGASRWRLWRERAKEWVGRLLTRIGVPGAIRDADINDEMSGQRIRVTVGSLFTRITVNGRDYFFHRFSGDFDGAGSNCR